MSSVRVRECYAMYWMCSSQRRRRHTWYVCMYCICRYNGNYSASARIAQVNATIAAKRPAHRIHTHRVSNIRTHTYIHIQHTYKIRIFFKKVSSYWHIIHTSIYSCKTFAALKGTVYRIHTYSTGTCSNNSSHTHTYTHITWPGVIHIQYIHPHAYEFQKVWLPTMAVQEVSARPERALSSPLAAANELLQKMLRMHVCMYVCMYVCTYRCWIHSLYHVHTYIRTYIHTYKMRSYLAEGSVKDIGGMDSCIR